MVTIINSSASEIEVAKEPNDFVKTPLTSFMMDIDCPSQVCTLEYRVMPTCYVYLASEETDCEIPCNLKHCKVVIRHFVECPVWTCVDKASTIAPIIPTPTPTPTPTESHNSLLIASLVMNTFFIVAMAVFGVHRIRLRIRNRALPLESSSLTESGTEPGRHFSLGEDQPLLSGSSTGAGLEGGYQSQQTSSLPLPQQGVSLENLNLTREGFLSRLRSFQWSFALNRWVSVPNENHERSELPESNPLVSSLITSSSAPELETQPSAPPYL